MGRRGAIPLSGAAPPARRPPSACPGVNHPARRPPTAWHGRAVTVCDSNFESFPGKALSSQSKSVNATLWRESPRPHQRNCHDRADRETRPCWALVMQTTSGTLVWN